MWNTKFVSREAVLFLILVGMCVALIYVSSPANFRPTRPRESLNSTIAEFRGNGSKKDSPQRRCLPKHVDESYGNKSGKYPPLLFYTRSSKCGGRSMLKVMEILSEKNDFHFDVLAVVSRRPPFANLITYAREISKKPTPGIYETHFLYTDFTKFGLPQPVYFNMIRDPIDQFVSLYSFSHYGDSTPEHTLNPTTNRTDINECIMRNLKSCWGDRRFDIGSFFCGQQPHCTIGSPESVATAKRHINENYIFVGITEEFENTLRILEKILPDYLSGAMEAWKSVAAETKKVTATKYKQGLNATGRSILRHWLRYEYEVYNHVKATFNTVKNELGLK